MQRSICRLVGACGLIFTFTIAANGASGGVAAAGGVAASGATAASAGSAGTAAVGAANGGRTAASGTAAQGQGVSTIPGQSLSVAPPTTGAQGQPTPSTPASAGNTISAPNSATTSTPQTTGALGTPTAGATVSGTATTTGVGASAIGTTTAVPFNTLPAAIQSQIASQLPIGAQLGNVVAESTPQGVVYRAQVMQNGVVTEMSLPASGIAGTVTPGSSSETTASTTGLFPGATVGTDGFVVGTPYSYAQLPAQVQTAFAAQGATGVTNVTWTPTGNGGGVFHAMADGKPVDIRVAANGRVIPTSLRNIARAANTTTNAMTIEDVPVAVRDAIRTSAPYAEISRISKTKTASGDVYDITMRANDHLTMMQISDTGKIIKDNQDIVAAVSATTVVLTNVPPKLAWNSLPPAVRDSIEVQTQPDTVKTLALTNYLGKTAYVVDYVDKDAIRNRLYINKEGLVVDTQTNLFGIALTGKPVVIDDLPAPARDAVKQQAENSAVTRIDLAMYGLTPVYVVTYQRNGEARQMVLGRDGRRVDSAVGAPATTVIGSEKATSAGETKPAEPERQ
jgi:uncharacterized protein YpmB